MIGCRPLLDWELEAVLKALGRSSTAYRDQALFILGITTGFRVSELISLRVRDLWTAGVLNSHVRIPASRMKGRRRPRSAVLAQSAHPFLVNWLITLHSLRRSGGNSPLFASRRHGRAISRIQAHRVLKRAFEDACIEGGYHELATHCMRKTFAAKMWDAHDQNIWKVQNALGHASPASTVAYLSFEDSEQRAAVETAFLDLPISAGV